VGDEDCAGRRRVGEGEVRGVKWEGLGVDSLTDDGVVEQRVGRVEGGEVGFGLNVGKHDLGDGGGRGDGRGKPTEREGRIDDVRHARGHGGVDGELVDLQKGYKEKKTWSASSK
jgi:hypothetical protein